ncbi:hypothetical protein L798_08807 [Zootermopsis nevadensis]|uniref:Uncharacterized protein n=1 Tax=Zootermopsis nevadensis TaxID=136037 RepID=A0A067RBQ2_ZOONE|nr:hypothetical protein L798_08807 [Zootermopsis nevadensis]
MATEEENQEMLMSEAVNTDLVLGGKYLQQTYPTSVDVWLYDLTSQLLQTC